MQEENYSECLHFVNNHALLKIGSVFVYSISNIFDIYFFREWAGGRNEEESHSLFWIPAMSKPCAECLTWMFHLIIHVTLEIRFLYPHYKRRKQKLSDLPVNSKLENHADLKSKICCCLGIKTHILELVGMLVILRSRPVVYKLTIVTLETTMGHKSASSKI